MCIYIIHIHICMYMYIIHMYMYIIHMYMYNIYVYKEILFSLKKNEILLFAAMWMTQRISY